MSELTVGTLSGLAANSYVIDVASGSTLDLSNATDLPASALPAGSIIAVKDAFFSGTQAASVSAGANIAVTDLSITHEVADPANKLIISAFLGAASINLNVGQLGICGLAIHDGTSLIGIGDAAGSRSRISSGNSPDSGDRIEIGISPAITFVHTPGAGSKTYTVRAVNVRNSTASLYINRTEGDSDTTSLPRTASSLVIQEVAV